MNTTTPEPQIDVPDHEASQGSRVASVLSPVSQSDQETTKTSGFSDGPRANSLTSQNASVFTINQNVSTTTRSSHSSHQELKKGVRALPPWLNSYEEDEGTVNIGSQTYSLIPTSRSFIVEHNHIAGEVSRRISHDGYIDTYDDTTIIVSEKKSDTGFFGGYREPVKGRKWDHVRNGEPVIVQTVALHSVSPWRSYIQSSTHGLGLEKSLERVNHNFNPQLLSYQTPWIGDLKGAEDIETNSRLLRKKKNRRTIMKRIQHLLIMHPLVPLLFRLIVLITSVIALGISTSVHHLSIKYNYEQTPSSTMAIVVDVVALPYILYITWDEYTGKPLGLRAPGAKIRLVLLDLFFIIFESANLSLAFGTLTDDNGSCESSINGYNYIICNRIKALCGILMLALYGWSLTFAISIFRLVQRVGGKEED